MVFQKDYPDYGQEVTWDFRQAYTKWVDDYYVKKFIIAHLNNKYSEMYESLLKWHSIIWGRSIATKGNYDIKNSGDETFKELIKELIKLMNEHKKTYQMKNRDARAVAELDEKFNECLSYLIWLMKKNKLFGSDSVNRSL